MKNTICFLLSCFITTTAYAEKQQWQEECVGYYKMDMPAGLEVALYPAVGIITPRKIPHTRNGIQTKYNLSPRITFGEYRYNEDNDSAQAQYSVFRYANYVLTISSQNPDEIDFATYEHRIKDDADYLVQAELKSDEYDFQEHGTPMLPVEEFKRLTESKFKDYPDAFLRTSAGYYDIYINKARHIYKFGGFGEGEKSDKTRTATRKLQEKEPVTESLLSRFRYRELYEVPTEQGFCIPYGFIANDSGHEKRNMSVTYRLKEHPDVTIFFQDLGGGKDPIFEGVSKAGNSKDFIQNLWNRHLLFGRATKNTLSPKYYSIKIDGREGASSFVEARYELNTVEGRYDLSTVYAYVAYVKGNPDAQNIEPDLLLYVMSNSRRAKGHPPMDKKELLQIAERIAKSVKRR